VTVSAETTVTATETVTSTGAGANPTQPAVSTNVPGSSAQEQTATPASSSSGNSNLAFLPPGHARDLLLNNCSNCHSFVCAVIAQRSKEHLESVKATHRERVSGLTDTELDELFNYLYENFGDQKPAPVLPEAFAGQGCTAQ